MNEHHQDYAKPPGSACLRLCPSSSTAQVEHNRESAGQQICTGEKGARSLPDEGIMVIDEDLAISCASCFRRPVRHRYVPAVRAAYLDTQNTRPICLGRTKAFSIY